MLRLSHKWHPSQDQFVVPPGGWILTATILLSIILAGARPLWAQGVVTCGVGLLWLLAPPENLPKKPVLAAIAVLIFVPLAAYLPLSWSLAPSWRSALNEQIAIASSPFITPQPWLLFHNYLLWLTGVALIAWCASQSWEHYHRDALARMIASGIVLIAGFAMLASYSDINPSFWKNTDGFGPFENRNQWGTLLGLGGIMSLALIHQAIRRGNFRMFLFWIAALILLTWTILVNGSRGGLVVLAVGGFSYWAFFGLLNKNYRYAAIAFALLFISFAIFALGGGPLLERFVDLKDTVATGGIEDFRAQFYRMVINLSGDAKLTGFGLGNFSYIFPFYLDFGPMMNRRPLHPESSWLWILSEGGWLTILTIIGCLGLFFKLSYDARRSRSATTRAAGMAIATAMIINAFFEVSGHRIGTLFPAITLASLALPAASLPIPRKLRQGLLHAPGIIFSIIGLIWLASGWNLAIAPAIQGASVLQSNAGTLRDQGHPQKAADILAKAEKYEPLNWDIRWARGAYLIESGDQDSAWNDFRAAQAILPYMSWVLESEGYVWANVNPSRAAYAWKNALELTEPGRRSNVYAGFLRSAQKNLFLKASLLSFYPDDPEMEFARISATQGNQLPRLLRLINKTENLNLAPDNLIPSIVWLLYRNKQNELLDELVNNSSRIRRLGWETLATRAAQTQNLDDALALNFEFGEHPPLPAPISRSDLRTIERAAALAPMDISTAISYYQGLEAARRKEDAFWQLRRIMELPDAPPYIWYLAAKAAYAEGSFEDAWSFLNTYKTKIAK